MSHNLTIREDGTVEAAFAQTVPWHGLGAILDHGMTSHEALKEARLDWEVEQADLWATLPDGPDGLPVRVAIPSHVANVRADNHAVLGIVSKTYQVIQNWEAFDFLDSLARDELLRYESAFSLRGGKQVCLLARAPLCDWVTPADELRRYILFTTSHDGSGAVRLLPTSVRVVCNNTYRLALHQAAPGEVLSIRHEGDCKRKLEHARDMLHRAYDEFGAFTLRAQRLVTRQLDSQQWGRILDALVPLEDADERSRPRREGIRTAITRRFGAAVPVETRGTAWAAFNAVTAYVDHDISRSKAESRFRSTMEGHGDRMKRRALDAIMEVVA